MNGVALEIEIVGEVRRVQLAPAELRQVQRLAETSQAGSGLPLRESVAQRLAGLGIPIERAGRGWRISDAATIQRLTHS